MHLHADRLHLSRSDVTAFLACEPLTTLSLAHARGEIERPAVENEQAELIVRKGLEPRARLPRIAERGSQSNRDDAGRAAALARRAARTSTGVRVAMSNNSP